MLRHPRNETLTTVACVVPPLPLAGGAGGGQSTDATYSEPSPNPSRTREGNPAARYREALRT
jgi:hypothetical protein